MVGTTGAIGYEVIGEWSCGGRWMEAEEGSTFGSWYMVGRVDSLAISYEWSL